jgi:hypothetical protein
MDGACAVSSRPVRHCLAHSSLRQMRMQTSNKTGADMGPNLKINRRFIILV